jgi:hypothetical protein
VGIIPIEKKDVIESILSAIPTTEPANVCGRSPLPPMGR